jgi:cytidine deaminase
MKKHEIKATVEIYEHFNELPEIERQLCEAAIEARKGAYAIYSNFFVGSSILLDNGLITSGSNQENAVYPLGLCAERVAIFAASHQYPTSKMLKIAVSTSMEEPPQQLPAFPCGSCRQAIREQEVRFDQPIELFVIGHSGKVCKIPSITSILPFSFDKSSLG